MFNKKILSIIGVLVLTLISSSSTFAANVTVLLTGWRPIVAAIVSFIMLIAAAYGIWRVLSGAVVLYKLANDTANQQQQNTGQKGAWTGIGIGACLIVAAFVIEIAVGTFTLQETSDNAALTELLGAGSGS